MTLPERSYTSGSGYRFGFNGKETDKEYGAGGGTQDYGFRMYSPPVARFLSQDPLFKSYPWYTPYQFAGNKPTRFIDLDGLEEYDPSQDPFFLPKLFVTTVRDAEDAMYNTAITINNLWRSRRQEATIIRGLLVDTYNQSFSDLMSISDKQLVKSFEVKFSFWIDENTGEAIGYYLDTRDGFGKESLENLSNALSIAGLASLVSPKPDVGGNLLINAGKGKVLNEISSLIRKADDAVKSFKFKTSFWELSTSRPNHKAGVRDQVWDNAMKEANGGILRDPYSKEIIGSDWHMGHRRGFEYKHLIKALQEGRINQKQFDEYYNNPKYYQPRTPNSNQRHLGESKESLYDFDNK